MEQSLYDCFVKYLHSLHHPTYETRDGRQHQWPLRKMIDFCGFLGNPQQNLKIIHVAGTNGKGSCVSIIASYLQLSGYKVGIYISPEVLDFKERIQVNGEYVSVKYIEQFYKKLIDYSNYSTNKDHVFDTYSQVLVAMAISYFDFKEVDYAVIETGIGGSFDPTNIVTPILSVITSIGYDHTSLLGCDLESIAIAKSGIIKEQVPVVVGKIDDTIKSVFSDKAKNRHSLIFYTDEYIDVDSSLDGFEFSTPYQYDNSICCWLAIRVLSKYNHIGKPNELFFLNAVSNHRKLCNLRGRWEKIGQNPDVFLDICDNELGAKCVFEFVGNVMKRKLYDRLIIIMGLTGPSKFNMIKYFPSDALYYYTQSHGFISADEVKNALGYPGKCYKTPAEAISDYLQYKRDSDLVLIIGSIHIITDAIHFFNTDCQNIRDLY